jgi:hypothetical protein
MGVIGWEQRRCFSSPSCLDVLELGGVRMAFLGATERLQDRTASSSRSRTASAVDEA